MLKMQNTKMTPELKRKIAELCRLKEQYKQLQQQRKIDFFQPYAKQRLLHEAGLDFKERCLFAGNQYGKSEAGAVEVVFHATGDYPGEGSAYGEWKGCRFSSPVQILVIGNTYEQMRTSCQAKLLGQVGQFGNIGHECKSGGYLPGDRIVDVIPRKDVRGAVDYIRVKHRLGGESTIWLKSQGQAVTSIMGAGFHFIWWDEMPEDQTMYLQAIARTTATRGHYLTTATPESGYTDIVDRFLGENKYTNWHAFASIREAGHITAEIVEELKNQYPRWLWPVKLDGLPFFGAGRVYPFEDRLLCEAFRIPSHWPRIAGVDFGYSQSPTAIVWFAIDPSNNTFYLYDCFTICAEEPKEIAYIIRQRDKEAGFSIPVAWPLDGRYAERSTGNVISEMYADLGINMTPEPSYMRGHDGKKTNSVLAGVTYVYGLMKAGRVRVFGKKVDDVLEPVPDVKPLWEELKKYAKNEKGEFIKKFDHCMDAMRYAIVMADRFAESIPSDEMDEFEGFEMRAGYIVQ